MLKKSAIAAALVMFTSSAFALDGGQLDFAGLVSDNTCILHVNGGAQDGQINPKPQQRLKLQVLA